jgi:PAS domain S-box-containing protein
MDKRLKEINLRLSEYSLGKFDKRITLSDNFDDIDAIGNTINMLGEELKSVTISRDYFTGIFNSVSDMVFVLDSRGIITNANRSAEMQLKYKQDRLKGMSVNVLHSGKGFFTKHLSQELEAHETFTSNGSSFLKSDGAMIPVRLYACYLKSKGNPRKLILLTAADITFEVKLQNLIIRAIINTQEQERQRLAKDLHDSLTQQLTAIKMYISTTTDLTRNRHQREMLVKSKEALTEVIADMRNICFNLMPKILEEFGLVKAVQEFCNYYLFHKKIHFTIEQTREVPELAPGLKIDLYRVVQEFITNAVKHGKANRIRILFDFNKYLLKLKLIDNGKGFDCDKRRKGMGLQNVQSRVKSHDGKIDIASIMNKGTTYIIAIPVNI